MDGLDDLKVRCTSDPVDATVGLTRTADRSDTSSRAAVDFVRAAGHELRGPLTVAIGLLELVEVAPSSTGDVIIVLDELARMGQMLDDLQMLAVISSVGVTPRDMIESADFGHEVLALGRAMPPRSWTLDVPAHLTFVGDRKRLIEAMTRLLDNAVKNSEAQSPVVISVTSSDGMVHLEVTDSGCGIATDELCTVTDRFVRGRAARRRYRGAGLGLPIVDEVARAHGGRLSLCSQLDAGTSAVITLPLVRTLEEGARGADPHR